MGVNKASLSYVVMTKVGKNIAHNGLGYDTNAILPKSCFDTSEMEHIRFLTNRSQAPVFQNSI